MFGSASVSEPMRLRYYAATLLVGVYLSLISSGSGGQSGASDVFGAEGAPSLKARSSDGLIGFRPCPTTEPCRILPLGDSITEGMTSVNGVTRMSGGYREPLFSRALASGKNITFVGSRPPTGPLFVDGHPFPRNHEGTSGIKIQTLVDKPHKYASHPHIVLLHIGTNDLQRLAKGAPERLEGLLDQIISEAPEALLVVAQLIPFPKRARELTVYNAALVRIVRERAAEGAHILLVDQFTGFPLSSELSDGIHPNEAGYSRMASVWYEAIEPYLE
jgi:lysophospholipase L1-like esterase